MNVQEFLHFRGKTQTEVAEALGISRSYFSEMCRGARPFLFEHIRPLAHLIRADVDAIVYAFTTVRENHEQRRGPNV